MKTCNVAVIFFISLITLLGCSKVKSASEKNSSSKQKPIEKYSILSEDDYSGMSFRKYGKNGTTITFLLCGNKWEYGRDKYNRPTNELISPEMTYGELQDLLDFKDSDVTFNDKPNEGQPDAFIKTPWLTLNMRFTGEKYDGKNKDVKLLATVVENKLQKFVDRRGERTYRYPSIMEKTDRVGDGAMDGLILELVVNKWDIIYDKYGRLCKYSSPEMAYAELQDRINFNDSDVAVNSTRKEGEPHAFIKTPWFNCEITYLAEPFDGKNKDVKLKAILVDNEIQAYSDSETEYDKNKSFIRKILDPITPVHHP